MEPQPADQIALTPPPMTLRQHIEAEGAVPAADAAAPVVDPTDTPEQEAQSTKPDADLSEAARTLRRSRADERKARIQADIDALKREEYEVRDRIARLRREEQQPRGDQPRSTATAGAAPADSTDPRDPQPDHTDTTKYPDGQYDVAFIRDSAQWAARDAIRTNNAESHARVARETYERDLTAKVTNARAKYADFDAVLEPVVQALSGTPQDRVLSQFVAKSPVGEDVLYRLGKDPEALKTVQAARSPMELTVALATIAASVTAPAKPAAKPKTSAPPPPSQTVGAGATASEPDTRKGVPFRDHVRIENAREAERRNKGF